MSYLKFDKTVLINLEQSLHKEMLRTNKSGAYHLTTLADCNTRKHHGLLVIPIPELDDENHLLLSSLDETVIQHGAEFNLGLHKYGSEHYSPNGHKYIREYNCDVVPTTVYRVGGVILSKEKIFISHENRLLIRYTLLEAHSETTLRFRPFLAFRKVSELTRENSQASQAYSEVENGISNCMYDGYPCLFMQFNKKPEFKFIPTWYKGIEYFKDQERGYDYKEDQYVPGYFEVPIKKGESIIFSAGITETDTSALSALVDKEIAKRTPRKDFYSCLKNSAQQFYNRKPDTRKLYLLAGYPWLAVRARDQFIGLPGATLAIDDLQAYHEIMETSIEALRDFMKDGSTDRVIKDIDQPDVLLWCIWALQQYYNQVSSEEFMKRYADFLFEIISYIQSNRHENLKFEENGLIYSEGKDKAITWMHASLYQHPITPRTGYIVEFNALWYNALCFAAKVADEKDNSWAMELRKMAARTGESFLQKFKSPYGYLFDYVDGDQPEWSVRPNMLFAVALEYSPLSKAERKAVLDFVTKELLTPKGIRSLSPKSGGYNPIHEGTHIQRYYAYHQGSAWPWLTGFYIEAYLRIFGQSGIFFAERTLIGFEDEMRSHCIGSISELFDGNPPFKARGAISYTINVAEILRAIKLISNYTETY